MTVLSRSGRKSTSPDAGPVALPSNAISQSPSTSSTREPSMRHAPRGRQTHAPPLIPGGAKPVSPHHPWGSSPCSHPQDQQTSLSRCKNASSETPAGSESFLPPRFTFRGESQEKLIRCSPRFPGNDPCLPRPAELRPGSGLIPAHAETSVPSHTPGWRAVQAREPASQCGQHLQALSGRSGQGCNGH